MTDNPQHMGVTSNPQSSGRPFAIAPYLLGLFIVIQLVFIVVANIASIALLLSSYHPAAAMIWRASGTFSEPWAHLTGQEQYWRMFAPAVPPRAMFVRLRLRFGDVVELVPSEFESFPGKPILHLPGSGERLWHVEKSLALPFAVYDPVEAARKPEEWRAYLKNAIAPNRHRYLAYMAWKTRRHLEATGDKRVPDSVELLVSIHTPSRHDRISEPEFEVLALRWTPASKEEASLQLCTETYQGVECDIIAP